MEYSYSSSSKKVAWLALAFAMAVAVVLVAPCAAQNSTAQLVPEAVDLHTAPRAEVGVGPVSWDDTVAAYALSYAAKRQGDCALTHSGGPYGENIFWASADAEVNGTVVMASWVAEKQYYDHATNTCSAPAGMSCGHYTQVVWRKSTTIGCAYSICDNNGGIFVVCSYNPPGNVAGESPY